MHTHTLTLGAHITFGFSALLAFSITFTDASWLRLYVSFLYIYCSLFSSSRKVISVGLISKPIMFETQILKQ